MTHKVHIIAEAGTNHNSSPDIACRLIDVGKQAGADSIKFQLIYPEGLYLENLLVDGEYQVNPVVVQRRAQLIPDEKWREIFAYGRDAAIPTTASVFDSRGIRFMDDLDVPYLKIASTDLNNGPLISEALATGRKVVISTGMSTLAEVDRTMEIVGRTASPEQVVLLHCVSVYPAPTAIMNLGFISTLKAAFDVEIGFSDHTESSIAASMAIALGATWIEKHYTLDRKAEGFDHAYAMEPDMLAGYIADLRAAEAAITRPASKLTEQEATTAKRARRSLYAARDLKQGEVLTAEDVLIVRPSGPMMPNDRELIVGRPLARDVRRSEALRPEYFA